MIKLRLTGLPADVQIAVEQLENIFSVLSASPVYHNRDSKFVRIYVGAEIITEKPVVQLTENSYNTKAGGTMMTNEEMLAAITKMFAENDKKFNAIDKKFDTVNAKIQTSQKETIDMLHVEMENIAEVAADKAVQRVQVLLENREDKQIQLLMEGQQEILRRLPAAEEQGEIEARVTTLERVTTDHTRRLKKLEEA